MSASKRSTSNELEGTNKGNSERAQIHSHQSRSHILQELRDIGINISEFDALPIDDLKKIMTSIRDLTEAKNQPVEKPRTNGGSVPFLSNTDKKLLDVLLATDGLASSKDLSRQLKIPLSTVQRRRKRLEALFIQRQYVLRMERLGYRIATLFVSTIKRRYGIVGKEILEMSDVVTSVSATIGESGMDLKVEVVFRTSKDIMLLIDQIKSLEGVRSVIWIESIDLIGKKNSFTKSIP